MNSRYMDTGSNKHICGLVGGFLKRVPSYPWKVPANTRKSFVLILLRPPSWNVLLYIRPPALLMMTREKTVLDSETKSG